MSKRVFFRRLSLFGCVAALGLVCLSSTAEAVLLWYDGFEIVDPDDGAGPAYAPGTLGGQLGGTGSFFDTATVWEEADATTLSATSLTRPGQIHPSLGGSAADAVGDCCGRTSRVFDSAWSGFTSGTFYFGFFANFGTMEDPINDPDNVHHRVIEFHDGPNTTPGDAARVLMLGYSSFAIDASSGPQGNMKLDVGGTAAELDHDLVAPGVQPVPLAFDTATHFMVLKFELDVPSSSDTVSVYLDPVGTTEPAMPNASISGIDFSADRMATMVNFVFNGSPDWPGFDELRVADDSDSMGFANVANNTLAYELPVGVPEPASLCLVGLGAIGLVLNRRRK